MLSGGGVEMRKRNTILTIIAMLCILLMGGCNADKTDQSEEQVIYQGGGGGALTDEGWYFTRDTDDGQGIMLWFFDMASGNTVLVCDKAECAHQAVDISRGENISCNAQIENYDIIAYKDKIYYLTDDYMKLVLRRRNKDGNNDEKVATIDASIMGRRMWFYRDKVFFMASTEVSRSFDPETRESDNSIMRLFAVDLNSGETEIIAESSMAEAQVYAFNVYQMKDGIASFYDLEKDKWYTYEMESGKVEEQLGIRAKAKYGTVGEYLDICGQYCYDCFQDSSGNMKLMRMDWKTGEESIVYEGNGNNIVGYVIWGKDYMYIWELNREASEIKNISFYERKKEVEK